MISGFMIRLNPTDGRSQTDLLFRKLPAVLSINSDGGYIWRYLSDLNRCKPLYREVLFTPE
jgi:hypothetical protein